MTRHFACLALLAVTLSATAAFAADGSGQAKKEGGIVGDPRGAIRALGGTSRNDFEPEHNTVDVPKLGGDPGVGLVGGPPPGVTGGR